MSEENGHSMNGHGNGHAGGGTQGGAAPTGSLVRSSLNATRKLAEKGELATEHLPRAIEVCLTIIDGTGTERDKLAAMKVLTALAKYSSEAELELDRIGRLDAGKATERTEVYTVEVPRVGRLVD